MKKLLSNEISVNLAYGPEDIEYEPAEEQTRWEPYKPSNAWLRKAKIDGIYNEYGEEVEAPLWLLEIANEDAAFCNQLIQEKEEDLAEWVEERKACRAESILTAQWEAIKPDCHADYFGGIKRVFNG